MQIVREQEVPFGQGSWGAKYVLRGPHVEWGILVLAPGKGSNDMGRHYHGEVEETFFALEGKAVLTVEGKQVVLEPGVAVRVEPGEKHELFNPESTPARMIFIKFPYQPEDRIHF